MPAQNRLALGLDFGTESVRALLVDLSGCERASAAARYRHGQIIHSLPNGGPRLPKDFALQHPADWLDSAAKATRQAVRLANAAAADVISIGVDFTSCTMLPARIDGTPLCMAPAFAEQPYAWPKLWKHHAALSETERINRLARQRNEPWLPRYGGIVGLEWFFPKVLETLTHAADVYHAADVWLEAGDWFVWRLVEAPAAELPRSTCQAGYKAMWNAAEGYPTPEFFATLDRRMKDVTTRKMPGRMLSPGDAAGELSPRAATRLGLRPGTPVSAATIDAHAGVPGAGVAEPDTLVMVLGTSSCHMLNSRVEKLVPGVAGVVAGGILPGYFGYETGQAAVGDAFDWIRRLSGRRDFAELDRLAADVPPGAAGVVCVDWLNGCRTPLMDGGLSAAFQGLTLAHGAEHLYRALLEASACGVRWIVDVLVEGGVPVKKLVATGGLPHHNQLLAQIYADVLGRPINIAPSKQGPALGAAILGLLAAGKQTTGFATPAAAVRALASPTAGVPGREAIVVRPNRAARATYERLYSRYRQMAEDLRSQRAGGRNS
jgi:L-ribulokinase